MLRRLRHPRLTQRPPVDAKIHERVAVDTRPGAPVSGKFNERASRGFDRVAPYQRRTDHNPQMTSHRLFGRSCTRRINLPWGSQYGRSGDHGRIVGGLCDTHRDRHAQGPPPHL